MSYGPGEPAPESGMYRVVHEGNHKPEQEVAMVKGGMFLPCAGCAGGPRYRLVREVPALMDAEHGGLAALVLNDRPGWRRSAMRVGDGKNARTALAQ